MSCLTEKAIGELLDFNFFIPSYQRGYRWSERQIEDLLEDINAFIPTQIEKSDKKTWYCLQPVVVKECDERTKIENDLQGTWYEVIDGQQRLTSIFLIIHFFGFRTFVFANAGTIKKTTYCYLSGITRFAGDSSWNYWCSGRNCTYIF